MKESDFDKEVEMEVIDQKEDDTRINELFNRVKNHPKKVQEMLDRKKARQKKAETKSIVPQEVDTLREDFECPVDLGSQCGLVDNENADECSVCGYSPPSETFDDPDLTKVKRRRKREEKKEESKGREMNRPRRPSFSSRLKWSI